MLMNFATFGIPYGIASGYCSCRVVYSFTQVSTFVVGVLCTIKWVMHMQCRAFVPIYTGGIEGWVDLGQRCSVVETRPLKTETKTETQGSETETETQSFETETKTETQGSETETQGFETETKTETQGSETETETETQGFETETKTETQGSQTETETQGFETETKTETQASQTRDSRPRLRLEVSRLKKRQRLKVVRPRPWNLNLETETQLSRTNLWPRLPGFELTTSPPSHQWWCFASDCVCYFVVHTVPSSRNDLHRLTGPPLLPLQSIISDFIHMLLLLPRPKCLTSVQWRQISIRQLLLFGKCCFVRLNVAAWLWSADCSACCKSRVSDRVLPVTSVSPTAYPHVPLHLLLVFFV